MRSSTAKVENDPEAYCQVAAVVSATAAANFTRQEAPLKCRAPSARRLKPINAPSSLVQSLRSHCRLYSLSAFQQSPTQYFAGFPPGGSLSFRRRVVWSSLENYQHWSGAGREASAAAEAASEHMTKPAGLTVKRNAKQWQHRSPKEWPPKTLTSRRSHNPPGGHEETSRDHRPPRDEQTPRPNCFSQRRDSEISRPKGGPCINKPAFGRRGRTDPVASTKICTALHRGNLLADMPTK